VGSGDPEGVHWWLKVGPAAAQQLGGLVVVGVQEPLELLGGQGPNRQASALVDRRAELLQILVIVWLGIGVLVHVLLPSAS
jgi:hypothetical protein